MEIVPSRLRVFTLLSIILFKLAGMATLGATLLVTWNHFTWRWGSSPPWHEQAFLIAWPYREYGPSHWRGHAVSAWIVIPFLTAALVPFAFFLLPVSLRRARVRRAHFARVQACTLPFLIPTLGLWSLLHTLLILLGEVDPGLLWELGLENVPIGLTTACFTTAWLLWAWHAAVKHYLRLPHALPVALAMLTIAALTAATAAALLYGHTLFY